MEIKRLNSLRGLAAMIVLISHYSNMSGLFNSLLGKGAGQIGVMLFFVLSGFLMSYLYINLEFNRSNIVHFIIARIARVIPLFIFVVFCSYLLYLFNTDIHLYYIPDLAHLFSHLLLLYGESVLWTIPTEIQFYIFFIFLWAVFSVDKRIFYIFLLALYLLIVWSDYYRPRGVIFELIYDFRLMRSLPYFFAGIIFAQMYINFKFLSAYRSHIFILVLGIIPLLYPRIFFVLTGYEHGKWEDGFVLMAISLVFFVCVFFISDQNKILVNPITEHLGKISYSLYLLHMPLLTLFKPYVNQWPIICLLLFLLAAVLISTLSYRLLENPCRRLINSGSRK